MNITDKKTKDWETKKLGDICRVSAGNSAPQKKELFKNGVYPFFRTADVGRVRISNNLIEAKDYLNDAGVEGLRLFKKGTILLPKSGASTFLNHRVILGVDGYVASHLATINTDEKILNNDYLFHLLKQTRAQDLIQDHKYPSLNLSIIKEIEISFPKSLDEQKRIVGILDEVFEKIDQAKAKAEQNLQNIQELFESELQNIFSNNGDDWKTKQLGEVYDVRDGTHDSPTYQSEGYPLVTSKNLKGGFNLRKIKYISESDYHKINERSKVDLGDILFAMIGTIGTPTIIDFEPDFAIKNVALFKVPENQSNKFLKYYLSTSFVINKMEKEAKGTTQKFVGLGYLRNFPIEVPDLATQQKIGERLGELKRGVDEDSAILRSKIAVLGELKKSLLQKALNGEL